MRVGPVGDRPLLRYLPDEIRPYATCGEHGPVGDRPLQHLG